MKTSPLSNLFKVAAEIYHLNQHEQDATIDILDINLAGIVDRSEIIKALRTLCDWGVTNREWLTSKTPTVIFFISNDSNEAIAMLYEKFWEPYRRDI